MDVLSDLLASMRIDGSVLAELRCGGDWGIDLEEGDGIPFHYILKGHCWLLGLPEPSRLGPGDLVVAPHWRRHVLASSVDQPTTRIRSMIASSGLPLWTGGTLDRPLLMHAGTGDGEVRIVSGVFSVAGRGARLLIAQLPPLLHLEADTEGLVPHFLTAMDFIRQESAVIRPGYRAVASRLMDLLFIQIVRAAMTRPGTEIGLLGGLADPHLSRALAAIHAQPARSWTVAELAAEAGLSRTRFSDRFRRVVDMSPIAYLSRWRMILAEELLARPGTRIEDVRMQLGFSSGFSFARAFRAHSGQTPRDYRKSSMTEASAA